MAERPATVVRPLAGDEWREILAVTARAFWYDPLLDFFTRDLLHEHRVLPSFFAAVLDDLRGPGRLVMVAEHNERPRAIAGWLEPGSYPRPASREARHTARSAASIVRGRRRLQAARLFFEVDKVHPKEPHWYLALLATDPTAQGRGLGTALLAPVLERCDQEGVLAYTETQKFENVAWYARSGFELDREIRLADSPPVWCLRREPR
jgi:ribosomal protein S18 acetylase RimI-like enzyme